jgi:hypothetical protein
MKLSVQDLNELSKIKRRVDLAPTLSWFGYFFILLAFICLIFAKEYVFLCLIGAMVLMSHTLFNDDSKKLLTLISKFVKSDTTEIQKATETKS